MLQKLGASAENYLYSDTDVCLYKLGKLGETIVNDRIKTLKREELSKGNSSGL